MQRLRRHRLFTVALALCSLLFMQLAVAAHACPGVEARMAQAAMAGMPCAGVMEVAVDVEQPTLCSAHCQAAPSASADPVIEVPALPALAAGLRQWLDAVPVAAAGAFEAPLLARATPPPIALRHCCLRL